MTVIDRDFHIHTELSCCAQRETTIAEILDACSALGMKTVGISDHFHEMDRDFREMVRANRKLVEEGQRRHPELQVFLGCEAQMNRPDQCTITPELAAEFDYVLCAANHYHLTENPADRNPSGYAAHYLQMVEGAIDTGFVSSITHPFLHEKLDKAVDRQAVLRAYDAGALDRVLAKAGERQVAFELNPGHAIRAAEFFAELILQCRRHGVKIQLGSDSHAVAHLGYTRGENSRFSFEDLESLFGLQREDLFMPK